MSNPEIYFYCTAETLFELITGKSITPIKSFFLIIVIQESYVLIYYTPQQYQYVQVT